ncbi:unnamed protein product [Penicillium olsonii]|uniref:Zn(2)-C6 fungal-type domain-containing protein n=1 Tax=Penicillium olsonii TaxID=99116 RepID=A0A9W4N843_PENOL|nr:unnamed protein product [Penicillium olsonii]CAG8301338.1 unnamed protein product [Penicillium olsonii]
MLALFDFTHADMADTFNISSEPTLKRRKVRKGTRSCWECRRRKEKCTFDSSADICIRCHRRGSKCVGQEFPETCDSVNLLPQEGDCVAKDSRVDDACKQFPELSELPVHLMSSENETPAHNILTPRSSNILSPDVQNSFASSEVAGYGILQNDSQFRKTRRLRGSSGQLNELSQTLHQLLPARKDADRIIESSRGISTLFFQMNATPYNELDRDGSMAPESLFKRPNSTVHPILIARYMLYIANLLQHMHPTSGSIFNGLSEPPQEIMDRLTHSVSDLIISNDDLIACIEGLECMLIESWFQVNGGNLRKALITVRRALTIAQLMGYHRPVSHLKCRALDPQTKPHPRFLWFHCVFLERHICTMLSLPQTTLDCSMASQESLENDTPMGRLERIHCVISSRILERNHSSQPIHDYSLTKAIDEDLKQAAAKLPCKWWLVADLASVKDQPDALFWKMRRLFHQLYHYNLLVQLHLPYMINSSTDKDFNYSRIACVNAAREVLSRFLAFRNFNKFAFSCRTYDFFGLMAGLTLLIAHLDSHRRTAAIAASSPVQTMTPEDLLAHQRPSDLALVEQIQESMVHSSQLHGDALNTQSARLLKRLMNIEAQAAGKVALNASDTPSQTFPMLDSSDENHIHLNVPYAGTVQITPSGIISKLPKLPVNLGSAENDSNRSILGSTPNNSSSLNGNMCSGITPPDNLGEISHMGSTVGPTNDLYPDAETHHTSQYPDSVDGSVLQGLEDPLLTAGTDDWAFQGVDMAFFDNLMRWGGI